MVKSNMRYCPVCRGTTQHINFMLVKGDGVYNAKHSHYDFSNISKVSLFSKSVDVEHCNNCNNDFLYEFKFVGPNSPYSKSKETRVIPIWRVEELYTTQVVKHNKHTPDFIIPIYKEASKVLSMSYIASAALLRLAFEMLAKGVLSKSQDDTSDNLFSLITKIEKEFPAIPKNAIDLMHILRKAGNDGIHGMKKLGKDLDEETVLTLFEIFNAITQEMIGRGIELEKLKEDLLPKVNNEEETDEDDD